MQKSSVAVPVMIGLAGMATTLPVFAGYVMGFSFVVWLVASGQWRLARLGQAHLPGPEAADHHLLQALAAVVKPVHWGVLALILAHLLAALLGCVWSPWSKPLGHTLAVWSHTAAKVGLLWFVVSSAMIVAVRQGWTPRRLVPWLLPWLTVELIYCLVQHWTGIDWTHGWRAVLPPQRFAYGVYRVSGFMGHPLTFAYNHMLVLLAAVAMVWRLDSLEIRAQSAREASGGRWQWAMIAGLCLIILLVSGSRYVLLVVAAALLCCEARRLWASRWWVLAGSALAGLVLWLEGSALARFSELFAPGQELAQRFPRLIFWRLHWHMFCDYPLFGTTMAGLDDALVHYYTAAGYHDTMYTAHHLLLQYLADTGVIGTLGLAALGCSLLVSRHRLIKLAGSKRRQGLGYLLTATALCSFMQNNLRDSAYVYCLWFYLSLVIMQSALLYARQPRPDRHDRKPPENLQSGPDPQDHPAHL